MGKSGRAFSLVLSWELEKLRDIQAYAKTQIIRQATPFLKSQEPEKRDALDVKAGRQVWRSKKSRVKKEQRQSKKRM